MMCNPECHKPCDNHLAAQGVNIWLPLQALKWHFQGSHPSVKSMFYLPQIYLLQIKGIRLGAVIHEIRLYTGIYSTKLVS